jgi:ligand-binding sensor domain-containing protein
MAGSYPLYNSAALDTFGNIWGLTSNGIFRIDTNTFTANLAAQYPVTVTGGFAMNNGKIYFSSGS